MTADRNRHRDAFTVLELLITVGVIVIVSTMIFPISQRLKQRSQQVKCMSHMRTIHSSFTGYISDKGEWPQLPPEEEDWDENKFFRFWVTALEPYGANKDLWLCPSDNIYQQMWKERKKIKDQYFGSYVPTPFDDNPGTPFRWNQPWLIERGDFHGKGGHMLMPDGSINESQNPFHGR